MEIVYYSIAIDKGGRCQRQWTQSIRSLRRYNQSIPVHLFLYNSPPQSILAEARRHGVTVHTAGDYAACLACLPKHWQPPLAWYPAFHKFLSLTYCRKLRISQLLYADCDTFFLNDVAILFRRYRHLDWYAREEPMSSRSHHGYNSSYLDEARLARIVTAEGLRFVPPYNLGLCMMNHGLWRRLDALSQDFLRYTWRFLAGISKHPECDPELAGLLRRSVSAADRKIHLPYPSSNTWIVDQVAFWLTMGRVPDLSHDVFSTEDVLQGAEYEEAGRGNTAPVVIHYYSSLERHFFRHVPRILRPPAQVASGCATDHKLRSGGGRRAQRGRLIVST